MFVSIVSTVWTAPCKPVVSTLMVHYKMVSIDEIMLGFAISIEYCIRLGTIESTDLGSLIGSYKRYQNDKLGVSLHIID